MAKFYGMIGFMKPVEGDMSVWTEDTIEKPYYGDTIRVSVQYSSADKLHDDVRLNNEISIIADDFAIQNAHLIRYVVYMGAKWAVTAIKPERPRIILSIGGVYNG